MPPLRAPLPPRTPPSVKTAADFFAFFHTAVPSATPLGLGRGEVRGHGSTYDLALNAWEAGAAPRAVLDLCCGDGHLLKVARARWPGAALIGVDRVRAEAEAPLSALGARFIEGDVGALPLPDACVDLAVFHMCFAFLPDPAGALREVARVLRPGGRVSIVIGGPTAEESIFQRYQREAMRIYRSGRGAPIQLHAGKTRDADALLDLARGAGLDEAQVSDHTLILDGDAETVWACLATSYDWCFFEEEDRAHLRAFCARALEDAPGPLPCRFGLRRLVARSPRTLPLPPGA